MINADTDCSCLRCRRNRGFTLIEILLTVAILAVVLAIAVPNIDSGQGKTRHLAREFKVTMAFARTEAVSRARPVIVCASSSALSDEPECSGTWQSGWLVYVDTDGSASPDASEVIRRHAALPDDLVFTSAPELTELTFSRQGFSDSTVDFTLCSTLSPQAGRTVAVAASGRAFQPQGMIDCSS